MRWRMARPCADCPFNKRGAGYRLRLSLAAGRWREIVAHVLNGDVFWCHKTTGDMEDADHPTPSARACAGSIAFANERGTSSNFQRVCERIEKWRGRG